MELLRAQPDQLFEYGPFSIRRQRPGEASALLLVDQMTLQLDASIPLQTHQDEEIFSYVWRGSLQQVDENGAAVALNARRAMLVNAGSGVRYAQSAPFVETELLQAVIRPAQAGGDARITTLERAEGAALNSWTLLAGPEGSAAPLPLRQAVYIYDLHLARGQQIAVPQLAGFNSWMTLLDGIVQADGERMQKGDSASGATTLTGEREARLVAFLVQQ